MPFEIPVAARELQARFDRLGAAVAEERALQSRQRRELRRQLALQRVVIEVRRVNQRLRLVGDALPRAPDARVRARTTPMPEMKSR